MADRMVHTEASGFSGGRPADPCVMVIFGATGDLTRRDLVPALFELECRDLLPEGFAVVGFARREWDDEMFREKMRAALEGSGAMKEAAWGGFSRRLHYVRGDFSQQDYGVLEDRIRSIREADGIPDNVLFHLAVPPEDFGMITERLERSGLASSPDGWRRAVVEKPFGRDAASADTLNDDLLATFSEDQIYRIDHFLGKETVQNMLVFRFANPSFEPIWNRNYIDHVQITVAEELGIGTRARFYEQTGILRDMVQNHLLQLLCLAAIEPPVRFDADSLRDETVKVLKAVRESPLDPVRDVVLGQYGSGRIGGEDVPGYRSEEGVDPGTVTPTFAALRLTVDNWRWAGVPFYLRTGKRMPRKLTEVAIQFKPTPHLMFPPRDGEEPHRNLLAFRLQPDEGIVQTFAAKQPGPEITIRPVTMDFEYADAFGIDEMPRAYSWLLLDVMQGDQRLFARMDWIREAWHIVDPVVSAWEGRAWEEYPDYAAGTWGPAAAHALLEREGRGWREA